MTNKIPLAIVIRLAIENPGEVPDILDRINPMSLPEFAGQIDIIVGTDVADLDKWLNT